MKKEKLKYFGFFGFLGFFGFSWFKTHDVGSLFFFSFFAFFSFFLLGCLMADMPDERYVENSNKAKLKAFNVALIALFLVGWSASFFSAFAKEAMIIIAALGWAFTFLTYAALFAYYEKH